MLFRVAGARDCAPCQKWAKREGFVACPKTMAGVGHLKRICKDAFSVAGAIQETSRDMFIRAVRRSGRWFPERGYILEHQIFRFAEMILRDRCSTSYDLASLFRGRRSRLDKWSGKIAKTHWYETISSALNFPFLKEVSQNCFVFDVVNFENWRSLAELLRFWCCQLQKMRKSRRIASFLTLSSSKIKEISLNCCVLMFPSSTTEEVSQNSFVLKLADRQIDRETTTAATTTTSTTPLRYYYNYKHTTPHYTTIITLRYTNYI